jgi:hypothetical protein
VKDDAGNILVTAYPVERPDGQWSIMLINKDEDKDHSVKVVFADPVTKQDRFFSGTVDRIVFGPAEYQWHPDPIPAGAAPALGAGGGNGRGRGGNGRGGGRGHADPDGPPSKSTVAADGANTLYDLPKASIIVLRGKIAD